MIMHISLLVFKYDCDNISYNSDRICCQYEEQIATNKCEPPTHHKKRHLFFRSGERKKSKFACRGQHFDGYKFLGKING